MTAGHNLERLRRSIAMLSPGQRDALDREAALRTLAELQEVLQRLDRLRTELRRLAEDDLG